MEKEIFDTVLSDIIIKRTIENEYSTAVKFDSKDKYQISCYWLQNDNTFKKYKTKLFKIYENLKKSLKSQLKMDISQDKLDCHKVAAVLLAAILKEKPVKFSIRQVSRVDEICNEIKLINYRIAFKCACGVIFADMIAKLKNDGQNEALTKLTNNGQLFMPKVRNGLPSYLNYYAKILYENDRLGRNVDYLEISDTLFLIELLNYKFLLPETDIVI